MNPTTTPAKVLKPDRGFSPGPLACERELDRPAWELALRSAMRQYNPGDRDSAVAHVNAHGTLAGCPDVYPEDLDGLSDVIFDNAPGGDEEGPPAEWSPSWDAVAWEPTPDDASWWAAEGERSAEDFDRMAAVCRMTDADVAAIGACG